MHHNVREVRLADGDTERERTVYVPVTESMPDTGQDALKPFIGEHGAGNGQSVRKGNGGHAIEISEIHKLPVTRPPSKALPRSKRS